jgi:hypothetical protein
MKGQNVESGLHLDRQLLAKVFRMTDNLIPSIDDSIAQAQSSNGKDGRETETRGRH